MKGLELHVLSHTHWDREWYRTFQQFRRQMVLLIDELLEILESDPDFAHFHLDGQSIVLEDYLEIRPENEKRLAALVEQGRIAVGPWYVLSDLFLTRGESTIRNLLIGHKVAGRFGKVSKVGYMPDQFGIVSQMPQILKGFGIEYAVFGRGFATGDDRKAEIAWSAPDDTVIHALFLPNWYNNFMRPPNDLRSAAAALKKARDRLLPHCSTPFLLFFNGCDHLNVQAEMGGLIKRMQGKIPGARIVHTRLEDYLEKVFGAVKSPTPWRGEFREDWDHQILAGTLSTRVYLKQANDRCEDKLLSAETLQVYNRMLGNGYDADYLEKIWKLLLTNHPHDSICGCSIDPVHQEMMIRFAQAEQMADVLGEESMSEIAGRLQFDTDAGGEKALLVVNPTAIERNEVIPVSVDFPLSQAERKQALLKESLRCPKNISLIDEEGGAASFHLVGTEQTAGRLLSRSAMPHTMLVQRFHLQVPVTLKPFEYRSFQVLPKKSRSAKGRTSLKVGNNRLENQWVQVMVGGDGSISIRDKTNGHLYGPLLVFENGGDVGDEYLFRRPDNDRAVTTEGRPAQTRPVGTSPYQGTLQVERIMPLPETADLNEERRVRRNVDCVISTRITLKADDPTLYCETRLENRAQFHRLRVLFQSNLASTSTVADAPFDIVERPAQPPEKWKDAARQFPLSSFVAIEHERQGLAVFTRGLHAHELINTEQGILALTLLRCVGHLARGKECFHWYETPEAQCLGVQRFEYAVCAFQGKEEFEQLPRRAEAFRRSPLVHEFAPGRGKLPRRKSLLSIEPDSVLVTALKQCEHRDSIVVRMVNLADEPVDAKLVSGFPLKEAHLIDLLENRVEKTKLFSKKTEIRLPLKAKEIATLELVV